LLLLVAIRPSDIGLIDETVSGIVDGVLLHPSDERRETSLPPMSQKNSNLPYGLWTKSPAEAKRFHEAGGDFVVFPAAGTPLPLLSMGQLARVLEVDRQLSDIALRTVETTSVDAVLLDGRLPDGVAADVQWLLETQRVGLLTRKPIILSIDRKPDSEQLAALAETSVLAVVVSLGSPADVERLSNYHQAIAALPPRGRQGTPKRVPILPLQEMQRLGGH
jgi:hypothetical protein